LIDPFEYLGSPEPFFPLAREELFKLPQIEVFKIGFFFFFSFFIGILIQIVAAI